MNTFNIALDLNKSKVTTPIRLRQGDLDGTTITALILDHGATADLTGLAARFVMELPGGEHYYRKDATVGEGSVTVVINEEQAASVTGRTTRAYFQLLDGETVRASTGSVTVDILPDALEGHTVPADYDSAIQDAIDALDDAVENIADTVEDVLEDHPEWTTTVQDGSITEAKLATDLARDRERLLYRLDNLLTNALPEGETATATDAARTPMAALALYGRSTQAGTPTPSAPVPIVSVTGVNLADPSKFENGYLNNSGVVVGPSSSTMDQTTDFIPTNGNTRMSFVATTDADAGSPWVCIQWFNADKSFLRQTKRDYTENDYHDFYSVPSGAAYVRMTVTWMRSGKARCAVYAGMQQWPYIPFGGASLLAVGRNVVNMAANYPYTYTDSGVTWTVNEDGSVTASGTASANSWSHAGDVAPSVMLAAGTYTTYAVGADGNVAAGYRVRVRLADGTVPAYDNGVKTFTVSEDTTAMVCLVCNAGTVANNNIVRAMLWRGSTATAYQPYESTVTSIPLDGHELRSLPNGTRDEVTVDARGHAVLVQRVQLTTQAVTDGVTGTVGVDVMSSTGAIANGATVLYKLAAPQTIDLGAIDPAPLAGPDLTAQAVPSAPFALTYERDLTTTLARLESAIADVATS